MRVNWLTEKPKEEEGDFIVCSVALPFVQYGNISICTIGDSQTRWSNAQNLRLFLSNLNKNFVFVGSKTDIYGYPHEGEGGNNTEQVLKGVDSIPKADVYTVLLGTNDYKNDLNETLSNLNK